MNPDHPSPRGPAPLQSLAAVLIARLLPPPAVDYCLSMAPRLLAAAIFLAALAASRNSAPFNDNWIWHRGELPHTCSTPDSVGYFPIDQTNQHVSGLAATPEGDASANACAATCGCTCQVWQWCNVSDTKLACAASSPACWTGLLSMYGPYNVETNAPGWLGGARLQPPTPPMFQDDGPASFYYDESAFVDVALPHDMLATGTPVDSTGVPQQQHGYVPFVNAWYRKSFVAPFGFSLARLYFDGCYRSCTVYLNGAYAGHHEEGYTGKQVTTRRDTRVGSVD